MFLFPQPNIAKILEKLEDSQPFNAVFAVRDKLAEHLETFPERHKHNMASVLGTAQPAWTVALEKLRAKILRPDGSIIGLIGPRGTGKTQMAFVLTRYCAEQAICEHTAFRKCSVAAYASLPFLQARVRSTYNSNERGGDTELSIIRELSRCRLLVLDEIHEGSGTDWASGFFTALIDRRYAAMLDTILISNETPDAFIKTIGPSVADRMRETGGVIVCDWPSFRTATAEAAP